MDSDVTDIVGMLVRRLEDKAREIGRLEHDITLRDTAIKDYQRALAKGNTADIAEKERYQ